jgi:SAM-dependent methyltransferase
LLPFADGTFDVVVCKEFAHHVKGKQRLFAEANRVLRFGGALVVMEPVRSIWTNLYWWRYPDPRSDHVIVWPEQYLSAVRSQGFRIERQGSYFSGKPGRSQLTRWIKATANQAVRRGHPKNDLLTWTYEHVVGASLVILATKQRSVPMRPRPRIRVISPSQLQAPAADGPDYGRYLEALRTAAYRLPPPDARVSLAATSH